MRYINRRFTYLLTYLLNYFSYFPSHCWLCIRGWVSCGTSVLATCWRLRAVDWENFDVVIYREQPWLCDRIAPRKAGFSSWWYLYESLVVAGTFMSHWWWQVPLWVIGGDRYPYESLVVAGTLMSHWWWQVPLWVIGPSRKDIRPKLLPCAIKSPTYLNIKGKGKVNLALQESIGGCSSPSLGLEPVDGEPLMSVTRG